MSFDKIYSASYGAIRRVASWVNIVGISVLLLMMLMVTADIFARKTFNASVKGIYELVEFQMSIVIGLGIAYAGIKKSHITVDMLTSRFKPRVRQLINGFGYLASSILFLLMCWKNVQQGITLWHAHSISVVLLAPRSPFLFILAFGCGLLGLVFLLNSIECWAKVLRK